MSDTPRTDAHETLMLNALAWAPCDVEFARTLERELTSAHARIAELSRDLHEREQARRDGCDLIESQRARISELEAALKPFAEASCTQSASAH